MRERQGVRRVKCGIGGSHSSSVSELSELDEPDEEFFQNLQPFHVEFDDPFDRLVEVLELVEAYPIDEAARSLRRSRFLNVFQICRMDDRADLPDLDVLPEATERALRRQRPRRWSTGV